MTEYRNSVKLLANEVTTGLTGAKGLDHKKTLRNNVPLNHATPIRLMSYTPMIHTHTFHTTSKLCGNCSFTTR